MTDLQRRSDSLFDTDKAKLVRVVLPTLELPDGAVPGTKPVVVDRGWYVTLDAATDLDGLRRLPSVMENLR